MFEGINQVTVLGVISRDPELKYSNGTNKIVSFTIETCRSYQDKIYPEYHSISAFNDRADKALLIKKNDKVLVSGRLQTRSYQKDGEDSKRYITSIAADSISILAGSGGVVMQKGEAEVRAEADPNPPQEFDDIPF